MRNLLELSSDVYWEQDREFRFVHFSAADPGVVAALRGRMLGKRRWELPYSNVSAAQWRAHRALLAAGKPFRDLELCTVDEDGALSWASASGVPVLGHGGELLGYRGVRKDITQRKRDEALIALEHSVARALAGAEDGAAGVQAVLQAVCELQGWPVGRYFVADDEAGALRFSAAWGADAAEVRQYIEKSRRLLYRRGEGLSGRAWESGEPLWVRDVTADPRASGSARLPAGERLRRGALVVPVKVEARTLGVLSFASTQPRQPDARLLSSLNAIGVQLGQFVQRKDTEAKLRRDEEALRRFRAAIDMTADAIFLTERSSMRFVDVNQITCQRLGYSREQLLQMGPHDIFARPRAALEASFDQIIATGGDATPQEMSYRSANGEQRWAELHRQASRASDGWIIVTVARDITDRRLAEQKSALNLRRQERIARFGQEAIGERDPAALVQGAVQTVLEALDAEAVGYVERGPRADEAVLRTVVGAAGGTGAPGIVPIAGGHPLAIAFAQAVPAEVRGGELGLRWASACPSVAIVPVPGEQGARAALCVGHRGDAGLGAEELNFVGAVASVLSTALQRIDSETRLSYLAQFDALTGLPNRALLLDRFSQAIAQAERHRQALGVLFIDLDEFKAVNDTLGHAAGDELLKAVAERLRQSVRAGDTVARIAGDEFAVLLAELSRADDAALVAQKIVARLGEPITLGGQEALVTASIGVATFPNDGRDCEALLAAADAAMYRAKQSGRNMYQFFTADLNVRLRARVQTIAELRRALERGELEVHYQPKFDLARRVPAGAEALLRWRHPVRGLTPPAEFIPVLEESGLIVAAGEWVLEQACRDLKESLALGLPALPVAVNLSARQFRQQDLAARLRRIVESVGLAPGSIDLEITESQLVQDAEHAIAVMRELREAGIGVAIDDFGTGYSSLSYLTRFPVSALKIDRSFVARSLEEQRAAAIVHAIVDLAHTLGFTVIAEGIETEPQAAFLLDLGCDQGQGYLFARPQPIAQLRELLRSRASAALQA